MKKYKLVALVIVLAGLLVGGWYVLSSDPEPVQSNDSSVDTGSISQPSPESGVTNDQLSISFSYADGVYTYNGTVQKPTPCTSVESDATILESLPEQVNVNIDILSSDEICAQVIEEEEISGEFSASKEASIEVFLNGDTVGTINGTDL